MTVGPEMASINKIAVLAIVFYLVFLMPFVFSSSSKTHRHRRILHQPFFPIETLPPTTQPPLPPPPHHQQQPKYPFSTLLPPANQNPFFPFYPSPSPPPPPTSLATIPANISSLSLPDTSSSSSKPISRKLVAIAVSLALFSAALITAIAAFLLLRHRTDPQKAPGSEGVRLFPPNTASSDSGHKPPPLLSPSGNISGRSSEFLHIGTLKGIADDSQKYVHSANASGSSMTGYQRLGSPELHPLPPLPRHFSRQKNPNPEVFSNEYDQGGEEEEFFSPRASSNGSPNGPDSSPRKVFFVENFRSKSSNSRNNSYPSSISGSPTNSISSSPFIALNLSPRSINSNSPDSIINFPARPLQPTAAESPPRNRNPEQTQNSPSENQQFSSKTEPASSQHITFPVKSPPPPPPPPPPRFWEVLVTPSRETSVDQLPSSESVEKNDESSKPKLKPLHWDKVRASSDRAMVWDQLKSSSFQLNEEMIETLFMVNGSGSGAKDNSRRVGLSMLNQQYRVLHPKKSQNIAILLRALNVTIDEVCESLLEGSADTLGTELLESLLKMAPTREEEHKLKEFKDESPLKLGPAEKFLKAVLDIPFAFQRVHAMLYMANFDSDVEYLKRSFETLKAACEELKNSRMFLKLLEAVLKTGNRMNVGTNRGDALAFKLDTLLKLVDVKGTDGKTTLLHFVVQEISRAEGSHLTSNNQSSTSVQSPECSLQDDIEFRKIGLQIVSGLSGELTNVKKAADLDSDVLSNEVAKLARGIAKIQEVLKLNEEVVVKEKVPKFSESMNKFLNRAEGEIVMVQNLESGAFCLVREVTEYFHGNSAKEEAHPFRIFAVVRDFISILDQVCKEVGKVNERSIISSTRQFPLPVNTSLPPQPPVFPGFSRRNQDNSSDDESSS